ncbi:outer membrane beta-barrel protein [Mucilaginibacter boryungensis]|uniref:Outer membrane beta-barrel protein n=1 Tax=Mucilaginibacter boryungensis TaxID=768480 RepID=A0ABR9XDP3_9SPHI|nr:outer membrane beta-barrel protein [Mucilaginibacter boryungensis]MBE9665104.1 outer membrane beta-barrel protein [Mucilaginibacter boryungensis]
MKSLKISALVLALAAFTFGAKAQTKSTTTPTGPRLSIGADAGIPTGKLSDGYNWNLGGSAQVEFPIANQLFLTVNAGYNNIFGKKDVTFTTVTGNTTTTIKGDVQNIQLLPVKAGLKFFPVNNFYVQAEGGAGFLLNKKDLGYTKSTAFIYAPQVGVLLPLTASSNLDLGVRYEGSTKYADVDGSTLNFVALRVAYSFNL